MYGSHRFEQLIINNKNIKIGKKLGFSVSVHFKLYLTILVNKNINKAMLVDLILSEFQKCMGVSRDFNVV